MSNYNFLEKAKEEQSLIWVTAGNLLRDKARHVSVYYVKANDPASSKRPWRTETDAKASIASLLV